RTRTFHVVAQSQLHGQVAQVELGQRFRQPVLPDRLQARKRGIAGEGERPLPRLREGKIVWKPEVRFHRSPAPGLRTPTEPSSIREARNSHKELFRRLPETSRVFKGPWAVDDVRAGDPGRLRRPKGFALLARPFEVTIRATSRPLRQRLITRPPDDTRTRGRR